MISPHSQRLTFPAHCNLGRQLQTLCQEFKPDCRVRLIQPLAMAVALQLISKLSLILTRLPINPTVKLLLRFAITTLRVGLMSHPPCQPTVAMNNHSLASKKRL